MKSQYRKNIQRKTINQKRNQVRYTRFSDINTKEMEFYKEMKDLNDWAA